MQLIYMKDALNAPIAEKWSTYSRALLSHAPRTLITIVAYFLLPFLRGHLFRSRHEIREAVL